MTLAFLWINENRRSEGLITDDESHMHDHPFLSLSYLKMPRSLSYHVADGKWWISSPVTMTRRAEATRSTGRLFCWKLQSPLTFKLDFHERLSYLNTGSIYMLMRWSLGCMPYFLFLINIFCFLVFENIAKSDLLACVWAQVVFRSSIRFAHIKYLPIRPSPGLTDNLKLKKSSPSHIEYIFGTIFKIYKFLTTTKSFSNKVRCFSCI